MALFMIVYSIKETVISIYLRLSKSQLSLMLVMTYSLFIKDINCMHKQHTKNKHSSIYFISVAQFFIFHIF